MPPEYITETSLATHIDGVNNRIDDLASAVNRALDKIEDHEKRITDREIDNGVIQKGISNGEKRILKRLDGRRWRITTMVAISAVLVAVGAICVALWK